MPSQTPSPAPYRARRYGLNRPARPEAGGIEGRLRGVIPLMMATPEFQVC